MNHKTRKKHQVKFYETANRVRTDMKVIPTVSGNEKIKLFLGLIADIKNLHDIISKANEVWIFSSNRKKAKAEYERLRSAVIEAAEEYRNHYDHTLEEIRIQMKRLGPPNYLLDEKKNQEKFDTNFRLFNEYINKMVAQFGDWYLDLRLRHDPWDTDGYGTISIREVRTDNRTNRPWYPWEEELKKVNMCYGALLLEAAMMQNNFDCIIMSHLHGADLPDYRFVKYEGNSYYSKSNFEEKLEAIQEMAA